MENNVIILTTDSAAALATAITLEVSAEIVIVDEIPATRSVTGEDAIFGRVDTIRYISCPEPPAIAYSEPRRGGKGRGRGRADWNKTNRGYWDD
jgi:hypothetical protein